MRWIWMMVALIGCGGEVELQQPIDRFPLGDVFYLPNQAEGEWELVRGPGENTPVSSQDGFTRFVPDAVGAYLLQHTDGGGRAKLEVIDTAEIPFHNLMYLPSRSMAAVGDEVWVAQGYAPKISRLGADYSQASEIQVGPWPVSLAVTPDEGMVLVAQAGNDTLGFVDVEAGRLVDAVWVGDEPKEVVISSDGVYAYVSLATEGMVAKVDIAAREVTARFEAVRDARALALTADGSTLYVAGHRTGQAERYPYGEDPKDEERDIVVLDTSDGSLQQTVMDLGNVLTDLVLDEANGRLLVSLTASFPSRGLTELSTPPFESQLVSIDLATGTELARHTLAPAEEGQGYVLGIQAIELAESSIWVVAEGSEVAVELDRETLEEKSRVAVTGAPRDLLLSGSELLVHGSQSFQVHVVDTVTGMVSKSEAAGTDPRSEELAAGQLSYFRPGEGYGQNFSCNSCHMEGQGDTRVWRAGPLETWEASRPMAWLDGTTPLGWGAYVANPRTFGYTGFTSIIAKWPEAQDAEELAQFLQSLSPPPRANGWTRRDGQLSDEAMAGKELFEGSAGCASCHALPLSTSNETFENGITEHRTSTPILVGAYRHNVWLKNAEARSLEEAIQRAAEWSKGSSLSDDDVSALARYLRELTDRDFFVLKWNPTEIELGVGADEPIEVVFNQPVWTGEKNLKRFRLVNSKGRKLSSTVAIDGRVVRIRPDEPLEQGSEYSVQIKAGLESFDQRLLPENTSYTFRTAAAPAASFSGTYAFSVEMPAFNPSTGSIDESLLLPVFSTIEASPSRQGSDLIVDLGKGLQWDTPAIIDGEQFVIPDLPISLGFSLAQGSAVIGELVDSDDDGIIDSSSGLLTVSGPGMFYEGMKWNIERK